MAITTNGTVGSKDDIAINSVVQLDWNAAGTTFVWSIPDQPPGTAETLSNSAIKNPTIQVKKEHTRRIKVVVDGTTTDEVTISVRHLKSRTWRPAFGETTQEGARGWAPPLESTLDYAVGGLTKGAIIVGQAGVAGLVKGNVLRVTGEATIMSGLPGQDTVFTFDKALATSTANLDEALYVLEAGVDGSTTPASGALIIARFLGFHGPVTGSSSVVGEPVFVSDTGTLVRGTPGTNPRIVGSISRAGASDFDVAFCGAITFVDFRTLPSGTVSAPGLAFLVDQNSGIAWQSADIWSLIAGGAESARVSTAGIRIMPAGSAAAPSLRFDAVAAHGLFLSGSSISMASTGAEVARIGAGGIQVGAQAATHGLTLDNSFKAAALASYNTADQITNYERIAVNWSTNIAQIMTQAGGTGTVRNLRVGWNLTDYVEYGIVGSAHAVRMFANGAENFRLTSGGLEIGQQDPTHGLTIDSGLKVNAFAIYNTADQITNYERIVLGWLTSNLFSMASEKGGTGVARALQMSVANTYFLQLGQTGNVSLSGGGSMYIDTGAMYAFNNDTATGMLRSPAHVLSLLVDGNNLLQIGNVPASTTIPALQILGPTFAASSGNQRGIDSSFNFSGQTGTASWIAMRIATNGGSGAGSGTRRLFVLNSLGTDRISFYEDGTFQNHNSLLESNAANAGTNGAPPAQVKKYLLILLSDGTQGKIPLYAF